MIDSKRISQFIVEKAREANADTVILGVSGGVDSAVVLMLAVQVIPRPNIIPVAIPNGGMSKRDMDDVYALLEAADIPGAQLLTVNIADMTRAFFMKCGKSPDMKNVDLVKGNIAARCRAVVLYTIANMENGIVLGTTNKTEMEIGYFTKFGDGACDIEPIAHLYKTEVWELAKQLGVPQSIIDKAPSAGLWAGQTDEGEIGYAYKDLDGRLRARNIPDDLKQRIARNEHKKHMPANLEA